MTAMNLHRYPSPSGGIALGKMGVGATMMKPLPYDAEVEYLESTGTQWIDTGIVMSQPSDNSYIETRMSFTDGKGAEGSNGKYFFWGRTSAYILYFGCGNWGNTSVSWGDNQVATLKLTASGKAYFNSGLVGTYDGISNKTNSLWLFGVNPYGANYQTTQKKYWFKVVIDSILVRDFIPVRFTNELGVSEGAIYDRRGVGGMNPDGTARDDGLYRNQGTGSFVIGSDINVSAI